MDANRFDQIAISLSAPGARRRVLQLLAALPLFGALTTLLGEEAVEAKGRRNQRKPAQRRDRDHLSAEKRKKKKRKKKKKCKPQSITTTCTGKCGAVKNNCKKSVDCGPCDCDPACNTCETCRSDRV